MSAATHHDPGRGTLLHEWLAAGPLLTDGAWGTQLQARGLAPGDFPDAWNLSRPAEVIAVARDYVDAGSRIILTNTFGANRVRLAESGLERHVVEFNRQGVRLSREAAQDRVRVFASVGPSGKLLATGETNPDELRAAFEEQVHALAEAGPDALVIETMTDVDEATIAITAARTTGLPVVACMVFDSGKQKDRTLMGVTVEQAARTLADAGADVIGANCGHGIATFLPICRQLVETGLRPVWIKPNAGLPELVDGQVVYRTTPDEFASHALALIEAGAAFIGGCCGTNPDFIRVLTRRLAHADLGAPSRVRDQVRDEGLGECPHSKPMG
jgi:5-methyltetrahydrofolate--homocysteine methyltransferase